MSLQRKFAALLAILAVMALVNVGVALWTLDYMQDTAPWTGIQQALGSLNEIKRAASFQARLWAPQFPVETDAGAAGVDRPADAAAAYEQGAASIQRAMEALSRQEEFRVRIGASTSTNLSAKVAAAQAAGRAWLESRDPEAGRDATAAFFRLHELIERIETSVIGAADKQVGFSRTAHPVVLAILGVSVLGLALAGVLGVVLVRRWVVGPVRVLRLAADRLAKGDFAHRVQVTGRDELGLLSAEINHMAGMISTMQEERVERERLAAMGEMVRRLAHNLRNPLAGIRSLAELTRSDLPPDAPAQENQERIITTVDRFERWLMELLSATTPLEIVHQTTPVPGWLRAVAQPLGPMAAAKGVELRVDIRAGPGMAQFDPRHLEQAVAAVVINAIQASPRGQPVTVVSLPCEDGQSWEIRVADQGPGVPVGLADRIFRPYFTTKRDGNGIGLAVAKQVVEQHGGRIWVESGADGPARHESGFGAVFVMRMPLARDGQDSPSLAKPGQLGAAGAQDSDGRGRSEPPVFHPAGAQARRA